jgi:hypothetical protein
VRRSTTEHLAAYEAMLVVGIVLSELAEALQKGCR